VIPLVARLSITRANRRTLRLWLPLFLVWLVLLPFVLLLAPLVLLGMLLLGVSIVRTTRIVWTVLSSLEGTDVHVARRFHSVWIRL
jgi:hypothetical protein